MAEQAATRTVLRDMPFRQRLVTLRKQHGLTQQRLADLAGLNVIQIRRYETDASQPSVEAIRKLAQALRVTTDLLIFDSDERGPDDDLRLQFEAVKRLSPEDRQAVTTMLDSVLVRHEVQRLAGSR